MALRNIRYEGDPILYKTCREVKAVTPRIKELISDLLDTMYSAEGVGLAAPQVGVLRRIAVIDIGEGPLVFINPKILETAGEQTGDEGCLSVPGKVGTVTRPNYVKALAYDENLEPFEVEGTELLARAMCHEFEHLDGHLYVEHVVGGLRDAAAEADADEGGAEPDTAKRPAAASKKPAAKSDSRQSGQPAAKGDSGQSGQPTAKRDNER